ncbi:MAG TPA: hypothetical protein VHJ78_11705 [Actinomycetota bacterium]|nr:hypothetical protein [Actinomycetota bacterium]
MDDAEQTGRDYGDGDWLLTAMVDSVNRAGFSFGITLNIPGGLVSGWVVSGNEYFHGIANVLEQAGGESFADVMRQVAVQRYPMFQAESDDDVPGGPALESDEPPPVDYIHLRDARFFYGGNAIPGNQGVWWRGKISDVVGFTYGLLATE